MAEVTLTASMRANLYSLQQTANLMGTVQGRLSTGKKVNSALDNPNNYFTAQALTNRASDISALLDGMGQAIQTIKQATAGIQAAQASIDQMKALANQAIQAANTSASTAPPSVAVNGKAAAAGLVSTNGTVSGGKVTVAGAANADSTNYLVNLNDNNGNSLGVRVGDTLTMVNKAGGSTATFTVTETSTMKDVQAFMESANTLTIAGGAGKITAISTAVDSSGKLNVSLTGGATAAAGTDDINVGGELGRALGLASGTRGSVIVGTAAAATSALATALVGSTAIGTGPSLVSAVIDTTTRLTSMTDANGVSLGIVNGSTLSYTLGTGKTITFTVGASNANNGTAGLDGGGTTLNDLKTWLGAQGTAGHLTTATMATTGKLTVTNNEVAGSGGQTLTLGGSLATALGVASSLGAGNAITGSTKMYSNPQIAVPYASGSTLVQDLSGSNGSTLVDGSGNAMATGSTIILTGGGGSSVGVATVTVTDGMTVQQLVDKINAIDSKFKVSLNNSGQLVVDNETGGTITASGTGGTQLFGSGAIATNVAGSPQTMSKTLYAGFNSTSVTGGASAQTISQDKKDSFNVLRTQLDEVVRDASYQGTNLISGTGNSPLTVTFSEVATNASKLVIKSVDLTTTGLGIKDASGTTPGAWKTVDDVKAALSNLTTAANTLRTQAASLGYNLSTVQNRQDFSNNMIATLKEGADKLTLADMNEEGANMLALQTRSQLGTQSLSLASQANQSVMRLFG